MSKKKINYELGENIHDNIHRNTINWFPGHMNKAIKKIKSSLKMVDIILEIRDARLPLVSGNRIVQKEVGKKCRLIVINKTNLASPAITKKWKEWFKKQETPFIFINSLEKKSVNSIVELARATFHKNRLKSNPDALLKQSCKMMIIGLPNTGKSTIINMLASRQASKVANKPGQTRQHLWVKVDQDILLLDTPGVMPPKIDKHEYGIWLSTIHAIPDTIVPPEVPACFIVEYLINHQSKEFQNRYKIDSLEISLIEALDKIAIARGCIRTKAEYDYDRVYKLILSDFRNGLLGKITIEIPPQ